MEQYELHGDGTTGTDERGGQRHLAGGPRRAAAHPLAVFRRAGKRAIDKMWDEGTFDQKKLDELRGQHLRTPYKTF